MNYKNLQQELPQNQSPEAETSNPPEDEIAALVNLYHSGQMAKVEQVCRELLKPYPQAFVAINVLGAALRGQGKLQEAVQVYDKAVQLKPDYTEAYYNRGIVLKDLGLLDEALKNFDKTIQLKPDYAEAYNNCGFTLELLGQLSEAMRNLDKAIQLKPNYAIAYNNRGNVLLGLRQLDKAVASCNKAIQLKPDFAEAHHNRGVALKRMGLPDEAVTSCDKAIQLKPNYATAYNSRGAALYDLGLLDESIQNYDKAIQLKPDYAEAHFNRHALLLNPDDLMPAIKCMEKAVAFDPLNMDYRLVLGILWDYSGDTQKATTHFDIVESGESLYRAKLEAKLDAWRYIKSVNKNVPTMIGSTIHAFNLGIESAIIDGLVLEFGVCFGASICQISTLVDQDVHGFDSFQGLPESWHREAKGSYSTQGVIPSVPQNVILHDGWFEETLPRFVQQHPEPVRFMNIDCDLYSSTKTVLEIFAKQIVPGTVIVFDEYIWNEHWREDEFKAFQEAVLNHGWKYEYLCFSLMTKQVVVRIN
jgi:tetratricopeptide (TPR) repeat protein